MKQMRKNLVCTLELLGALGALAFLMPRAFPLHLNALVANGVGRVKLCKVNVKTLQKLNEIPVWFCFMACSF